MITAVSDVIDSHFSEAQAHCKAPSLAYGVSLDGKLLASCETSLPFRIASMTKSFTAAAVLLLRDRNLLQLDQRIGEYLPELQVQLPTADAPQITIRHLLTMSSGLATDDPWADRHLDADDQFMDELLSKGGHFAATPGTRYVYSNYGYAILGRLIARVTGVAPQVFIASELLEPLGMTSTGWNTPARGAMPYRVQDDNVIDEGLPPLSDGGFAPMGGLWSTIDDLLLWTAFLMDAFPPRDDADSGPLRRSSRREMQQVHSFIPAVRVKVFDDEWVLRGGYGMGLLNYDDEIVGRLSAHGGGLPGYGSHMLWYPDRRLSVVSLANVTYAPMYLANLQAVELLRREGSIPDAPSVASDVLRPYAEALVDLLGSWDDSRADEIFSDNVALDESYSRRREAIVRLTNGHPIDIRELSVKNAAVGEIIATAGESLLKIAFSLSSQFPARIQAYSVSVVSKME